MQIIILGMHRSGTSCVARLINMMGAYFAPEGKQLPSQADNPKGFWEREDVMQLNDEILQSAGGTWEQVAQLDFAKIEKKQKDSLHKKIQSIVLGLDAHRPWFLKDPRMCLVLPEWMPSLEIPVSLFVYRNPIQVAKSMEKRNNIPLFVGIALWEFYIVSALKAAKGTDLIFTHYEDVMRDPVSEVTKIYGKLQEIGVKGLRLPSEKEITSYVTPDLFHNRDGSNSYPDYLNRNQLELIDIFEKKIDSADFSKLEISKSSIEILNNYFLSENRQKELSEAYQIINQKDNAFGVLDQERDETLRELNSTLISLEGANQEFITTKKILSEKIASFEKLQENLSKISEEKSLLEDTLADTTQSQLLLKQASEVLEQERDNAYTQLKHLQNQLEKAVHDESLLHLALLKEFAFGDLRLLSKLSEQYSKIPGMRSLLSTVKSKTMWSRVRETVAELEKSGLFDPGYYLAENPDVQGSELDPLTHFVIHGVFEGRRPNSHFDPVYYLKKYPDVVTEGINPLMHYSKNGWLEGRNPSSELNTNYYLTSNPDVAENGNNPLTHYLIHGKKEKRRCLPENRIYTYVEPKLTDTIQQEIDNFTDKPLVSIIVPVYNVDPAWLNLAIKSVEKQWYDNWELCIVDDKSTKKETVEFLKKISSPKIKINFLPKNLNIAGSSNAALAMAAGEYVALMDNDDELTPDALYEVVKAINKKGAEFIYSDEDKIEMDGTSCDPHFKADFSPDMFLSQNYLSHLGVIKKSLVDKVGGFTLGLEGAQDYDLYLKVLEQTDKICHIPKVLYHWRKIPGSTAAEFSDKSYAQEAGRKALENAMDRRNIKANVSNGKYPGTYRVKYVIRDTPLVSIIIPFKDKPELLKVCIESILNKSTYKNFEIIGISNNSQENATHKEMKRLASLDRRVHFHEYNVPFNYSQINNYAVKTYAKGEHIVLLNNDIEIISSGWIEAMLELSQRKDVGTVGVRLYYPDDTVQHVGIIIGIMGLAGHNFKHHPRNQPCYMGRESQVQNLSAVTAACLMIKKQLYEKIGGLNEIDLKIAFNDVDFCLRIREEGYNNVFTPFCEAYHHESISRGDEDNPEKQERFRNEVLYMQKRHKEILEKGDPFYNVNLTLDREDFSLKNRFERDENES